ncbi:MAG: PfkB family carbohydrate kinase [Bacillota bacterium]|nr:PfkB family carbohydrate kinase [Bacillota bacterium]
MVKENIGVIGTVFVDCKGFARNNYKADGRNLGEISFVHGGVGRNVAENLSCLGHPVKMISTVDRTALGDEVLQRLHKKAIDTSLIKQVVKNGMGLWMAIIDEKGELAGSISQMPDLFILEQHIYDCGEDLFKQLSHIILELDLNEKINGFVLNLCRRLDKPVYGIPGNLDIILKKPEMLQQLECFICNVYEAEALMNRKVEGLAIKDIQEILTEKFFLTALGSRYSVVTLGERGSIYFDQKYSITGYLPAEKVDVVDTSGAGDAFFSGTVSGLIHRLSLGKAVTIGMKVASWTISSAENNCPNLTKLFKKENISKK